MSSAAWQSRYNRCERYEGRSYPSYALVRALVGLLARRAATGRVWLGVMVVAVGNRIGNAIGSRSKNEFPILEQALWILI